MLKSLRSLTKIDRLQVVMIQPNDDMFRHVSSEVEGSSYCSNHVSTTRYTWISFLPKSLWNEFRKTANVYFLMIAVLQSISVISPLHPITAIFPLMCVVLFGITKEGVEDYNRSKSDRKANSKTTTVYRNNIETQIQWQDIQVGDLIILRESQEVPADGIVISSAVLGGKCFIDTCNLDGEPNLKGRSAVSDTSDFRTLHLCKKEKFSVKCEQPNANLLKFTGSLVLNDNETTLDETNLISRGSTLRNTDWIIMLVIYTGHDTKIMLNARRPRIKHSRVSLLLNKIILFVGVMQILLCAITSTLHVALSSPFTMIFDIRDQSDIDVDGLLIFLTYLVLLNTLIPISLVVCVECVKIVHAFYVGWDLQMASGDGEVSIANTSSLMEELGQIKYLFTDKTGTLTQNVMEFRKCSVRGNAFAKIKQEDAICFPSMIQLKESHMSKSLARKQFNKMKSESRLSGTLHQELPMSMLKNMLDETDSIEYRFVTAMALCNTVRITKTDSGTVSYRADSPDECALVQGAQTLGISLINRHSDDTVTLQLEKSNCNLEYKVLHVLAFNSSRKCMSIIVRTPQDKILLICKGADCVILPKCRDLDEDGLPGLENLHAFAAEGLRTLCFAERELSHDVYDAWSKKYHAAEIEMTNREEKVQKVVQEMECNLTFIGATAVEDKLQDNVPETISRLRRAGLQIWVLTGDMRETAIEIGRSCRVIHSGMEMCTFSGTTNAEYTKELQHHLRRNTDSMKEMAIVIDGSALTFALLPENRDLFLKFALGSESVIVSRSSPLQKAMIVDLVKQGTNHTTMAVGDGANDVSMIQTAHVGVGVLGQEGSEAVRNADYAIQQFQGLERLLLFHGRLSYYRVCQCINYFFQKNLVFTMPQFFFGIFSLFSGQTFFSDFYISMYNVCFTAFPVVARAITERNIDDDLATKYPELYRVGLDDRLFSVRTVVKSLALALLQAVIILVMSLFLMDRTSYDSSGKLGGLMVAGLVAYSYIILVVTLEVALNTRYWNIYSFTSQLGSVIGFFVCAIVNDMVMGSVGIALLSPRYWLIGLLCVIACFLPEFAYTGYKENFCSMKATDPVDIIRRSKRNTHTRTAPIQPRKSL